MVRFLAFLVPFTFLYADCSRTMSSREKRQKLMAQAVAAFQKYDTVQLFRLIDTAYCFDAYGKDGFIHKAEFLFNRFKVCNPAMPDSITERTVNSLPFKEYSLPFCRDSLGRLVTGSFDLLFSFADYSDDKKIMYVDVKRHLLLSDSAKIAPPIRPGN